MVGFYSFPGNGNTCIWFSCVLEKHLQTQEKKMLWSLFFFFFWSLNMYLSQGVLPKWDFVVALSRWRPWNKFLTVFFFFFLSWKTKKHCASGEGLCFREIFRLCITQEENRKNTLATLLISLLTSYTRRVEKHWERKHLYLCISVK